MTDDLDLKHASIQTLLHEHLKGLINDEAVRERVIKSLTLRLKVHPDVDDYIEWDNTDGAHPAWWRGQDDGVRGATERVRRALVVDLKLRPSGTIGYAPLQKVVEDILKLRRHVRFLEGCAAKKNRDEQAAIIRQLKSELESLLVFKRSVDEAINSGDGTYRP